MTIIIRNDDVLLTSPEKFASDFLRFRNVHELICTSHRLKHVPAIVVEDTAKHPDLVDYLKQETKAERMFPELHGLRHIDYGALTEDEVVSEIGSAKNWFEYTFQHSPMKWYTPWGANQPHLHAAAKRLGLVAVDCSGATKFKGRYGVHQMLLDQTPLSRFEGRELIIHWWDGLDRERLGAFVKVLNEAHTNN